ncbi:unnamed protein product [Euphydryas editha]|uniref:Uncharacterized protein n=1 Tax=Euphydryas editha TaxID=104508 RepID=A0AAU9UH09_EUPED|nr:unnamed protein product [Euphydryas editha]
MTMAIRSKTKLKILTNCSTTTELYNVIEGRGIGSTIWSWITYPFTWWSTDVTETLPEKDQLVDSDQINSQTIGSQDVIVQCNDQTCTTTKCDKVSCVNITCNIYDTDLTGQCRNYNTELKPEEPTTSNFTDSVSKSPSQDKKTKATSSAPATSTTEMMQTLNNTSTTEGRPLELEAVLSSTVTEKVEK